MTRHIQVEMLGNDSILIKISKYILTILDQEEAESLCFQLQALLEDQSHEESN